MASCFAAGPLPFYLNGLVVLPVRLNRFCVRDHCFGAGTGALRVSGLHGNCRRYLPGAWCSLAGKRARSAGGANDLSDLCPSQ